MAVKYILPTGTVVATNVSLNGAASAHDCVNDPVGTPDDGSTFVRGATVGSSTVQLSFEAFLADVLAINFIQVWIRSQDADGGGTGIVHTPFIIVGPNTYNGASHALGWLTWAFFTDTWTVNPLTGVPWTKGDLNPAGGFNAGWVENNTADRGDCTQFHILINYRPVPAGQNVIRNVASQILRRHREPVPTIKTTSPLNELLDLQIGDNLSMVHEALRSTDGSPVSLRNWKTHLVRLERRRILPSTRTVEMTYTEQREMLATFWFGAKSLTSAGTEGAGVALLGTGGAVTYLRNSRAWYKDPSSKLYRQFEVDELGYHDGGMMHEPVDTNFLARSSFVSQLTGLTDVAGTNGATRTAVTPAHAMFESVVTAYAGRATYGNNVSSGTNGWTWPDVAAATFAAGQNINVWVSHEDSASGAGDNLYLRIQRLVDNWYWNEGTRAWQAGAVDNAVPFSVGARAEYAIRDMDVGAAATGLRVSAWQLAGGTTVSRWNEIHHIQVGQWAFPTTPIVSDAAAVTRAITSLKIAHTAAKPVLRNSGYTFLAYYTPMFNADEIAGFAPIWWLLYGASNAWRFRYSQSNARFEMFVAENGNSYTAYSPTIGVVAKTRYAVAVRYTSAAGELGLAARTVSVFLNGVKGTDVTLAADPVEASVDFILGDNGVNQTARGQLEPVLFTPVVLTDEEIARLAGL